MHALKKRIVSVVLSVSMILTMLPSTMLTYGAEQKYTPEKLIEQGNVFYELKNQSGSHWTPMSLTPFTLKAAGLTPKVNYNKEDKSQYDYAGEKGKRFTQTAANYLYYNLLGEADRIFDLIADGSDSKTLETCVKDLLSKQGDDGLFMPRPNEETTKDVATPNAFIEARIILALDAYYGSDPEHPWGSPSEDLKKGRIAAIKALIQLWDPSTSRFKGDSIIPYPNVFNVTTGFKYSSDKELNIAFPIIALSSYTDCAITINKDTGETLGDLTRTTISKGLSTVEDIFKKNSSGLSKYNSFIYLTPTLLSIDGMEVDANVLPTMGNVKVDSINHKVDADHLIQTYGLINGLNDLTVYAGDEGLWSGNKNFGANSREFLTQQCVIAASDMIHGETAWKRIVSPNAKDRNDVASDTKAITIPAFTYDNLDLNTLGKNGSQINWESSDVKIIATNGAVTSPEKGSKTVTLTATITKGEAKKEKKFSIMVKSNTKDKAVEVLDRMMEKFDTAYKKDISSLGIDGVVALKSIGRDLEQYKLPQVTSAEGISATECAKAILQIVMTDKNPYDYNHTNYVEALCNKEMGKGVECAWSLLAFDAAGKEIPSGLLEKVKAVAVDEDISLQERSTAVYALASYKSEDGVSEALSSVKEAIKKSQKNGMFGADKKDHAYAVSALVSMGEDLTLDPWIQNNQTPFMVLSSEDTLNLDVVTALGDLMAENSVYQRIIPNQSSFYEILKQAKDFIDNGKELYSKSKLTLLETAYDEAISIEKGQSFGKCYYELKSRIKGLSDTKLTFSDANDYTKESIEPFQNAASNLQEKLCQKSVTAKELADYAKLVNIAYNGLEKSTSSFNSEKMTMPINMPLSFYSMMTAEKTYDLQKQIGQRMLDKTMAGYDAEYGYDVSKLGYWGVFEVCAMGKDISKYKVYDVTTHKSGALTTYQATDFAAIILQLVLTGENPYDYHGINYVDWLLKQDDGQGNFGPWANNIWALMALDAAGANYNENLIKIVINQAGNESFDTDMRGWALSAIQNHKDKISNDKINTIVESFKNKMRHTGDNPLNCFTLGCMITGLNAAGVDMTAEEWTAENASPLTALEKMQTENGSFFIGKNFQPAFVKDDIIALGDVVQGSNVWQRTCLTEELLKIAISKGESLLKDENAPYSYETVAALKAALESVKKISDIRGNGKQYFRLLDATKKLTYIKIPSILDMDTYDYKTFYPFKSAITSLSQELKKSESSTVAINSLCENVVITYDALKKAGIPEPNLPNQPTGDMDVFFTLLGDEKHDESKSHIYAQNSSSFDKWIPKTKVTVPVGSTVYDVFDAQLKKANITYDVSGASNNYVRWIQSPKSGNRIEEFTNGVLSGWMYTINGEHSLGGMKNDVLKNGDNLVWHYTDDYTKEKGSEKWSPNKPAITDKEKVVITIPTETKIGVDGKVTASISVKDMSDILKKAIEAAKSAEKESKKEVNTELMIEIKHDSKINSVETILPASSLKEVADLNKVIITIITPVGNLSFDKNSLSTISTGIGTSGEIKISMEAVDQSKTPQLKDKSALSRPIYQLRITSGEKSITNFKDGKVTISLPYTLTKEEKSENMRIFYVDDNGNLIIMKDAKHDEKTKMITFVTDHFSYYAIGYDDGKSVPKFKDIKNSDWFYENVMYLVEKGILKGKSEEIFEPNSNITRAEFVQILYNLSKTKTPSGSTTTTGALTADGIKSIKEFQDMKEGDWYAPAIAWAYNNHLIEGMTTKDGSKIFAPNARIHRQDMAVIIENYLENVSKDGLPMMNAATAFSDDAEIAAYAKEAVYKLQKIGILTGMKKKDNQGNSITIVAPLKEATRAEAAAMVSKLLKR